MKQPRRDEPISIDTDWVHDRFEDDRYDRHSRRGPPALDRYEPVDRMAETSRHHEAGGAKLRVDNLHYDLNEDDLRELFSRLGPLASAKVLYDRNDRSQGTAFVTYESYRDARAAINQFDGANANGQPIRLTLLPTAPAAATAPRGPLFDRVERPSRSLFDRIESLSRDDSLEDSRPRRRRGRSDSPIRHSDTTRPPPEGIDRYVPGGRSPIRRRGTPREFGRRPGAKREDSDRGRRGGRGRGRDEDGRPNAGGRAKKTAEELDAEMVDYWGSGSKGEEKPSDAVPVANGGGPGDDDIDMVE